MLTTFFDIDHLSEEDILNLIEISSIYYSNGTHEQKYIDFSEEAILDEIINCYEFEILEDNHFLNFINHFDGSKDFINIDYLSFIEMPLIKLEEVLCGYLEKY